MTFDVDVSPLALMEELRRTRVVMAVVDTAEAAGSLAQTVMESFWSRVPESTRAQGYFDALPSCPAHHRLHFTRPARDPAEGEKDIEEAVLFITWGWDVLPAKMLWRETGRIFGDLSPEEAERIACEVARLFYWAKGKKRGEEERTGGGSE